MIVDVYEGDEDEVLPVMRDELGNLALSSKLCGMRGDCNDLATVRVATCHMVDTDHEYEDSIRCDVCQKKFNRPWEPFKFCPNCGRKVVSDD